MILMNSIQGLIEVYPSDEDLMVLKFKCLEEISVTKIPEEKYASCCALCRQPKPFYKSKNNPTFLQCVQMT